MNHRITKLCLCTLVVSVLCALETPAQTDQTKPVTPSGVVSGRVTVASGELPPNTVVFVSTLGAGATPHSAIVNGDGTFKVDGVEIGLYRVWANAPGYVPEASQAPPDNRTFYHPGDPVEIKLRKGGVITGTVLNASNAPVVNVTVRAFRVKDEDGKPSEGNAIARERLTDDRGVYRMYGLATGTYIVSAGGSSRALMTMRGGAYDTDTPTYAPSSTRDTAGEVQLRAGEEVTVDIQYRGEAGHSISGTVAGVVGTAGEVIYSSNVTLMDVKSRTVLNETSASMVNNYAFAFYGIPDGEYELSAQQFSASRDIRGSEAKRIKVQGADITGISLSVTAMPAISGRVVLEKNPAADCVQRRESAMEESLISVRRQKSAPKPDAKSNAPAELIPMQFADQSADAVPDGKGDFVLRNLRAGIYRINAQPPGPDWFLRSIASGANVKATDTTLISDGIRLNHQSVTGLTITLTEGAAGIRGRVTAGDGQTLPSRLAVYIVPAEKENTNDLLRFFETRTAGDGRFKISSIAPGSYFILARAVDADRQIGSPIREDAALRSVILHEVENMKQKTTLKPCQRVEDFDLTYAPAIKP
jgi:hypothetical protein